MPEAPLDSCLSSQFDKTSPPSLPLEMKITQLYSLHPTARIPNSSVTKICVQWISGCVSGGDPGAAHFRQSRCFGKAKSSSSNEILVAWVTRPERPKAVKDVIKQARRAAA